MAQYNRAVFEMAHPRIRIRFQPWDMWSADYRSQTLVAVQSGRAPAVSVAKDWTANIKRGLFTDITEIMGGQEWVENPRLLEDKQWLARHPNVWTNFHRQPILAKRMGMLNGRAYTITQQKLTGSIIAYRKDWYEWVARKRGWDANPVGTKLGANKIGALCGPSKHPWGIWGPHPDWRASDFLMLMQVFSEEAELIARTQITRYTPAEKMPKDLDAAVRLKAGEIRGFSGPMGPWAAHGSIYWIPDPDRKHTWRFVGTKLEGEERGEAYEALVKAIIDAYVILHHHKWVESSAMHDWGQMTNDFGNSKVGMINYYTHLVAGAVERNKYKYGEKTTYAKVVGMVPPPYDKYGHRDVRPDANIFNFFPSIVERKLVVRGLGRMAELRAKQLSDNGKAIVKEVRDVHARLRLFKDDVIVDPLLGTALRTTDFPQDLLLDWMFGEVRIPGNAKQRTALSDATAALADSPLKSSLQELLRLTDGSGGSPNTAKVVAEIRGQLDAWKVRLLNLAYRIEAERYPQFWLNLGDNEGLAKIGRNSLRTLRDSLRRVLRPRAEDVANDGSNPKETLRFMTDPRQVALDAMVRLLKDAAAAVKAAAPSVRVVDALTGVDPLALDTADAKDAVLLRNIANRLAYETTLDLPKWLKFPEGASKDEREVALKALFNRCHVMYLVAKRRDIRLQAAFDWTESFYYGRMFIERIRVSQVKSDLINEGFELPEMLLSMPFEPRGEVKELFKQVDLTKTFPREYIETIDVLKKITEIPPLHHEYGVVEQGELVRYETISELYQEVLTVEYKAASEAELREKLRGPVCEMIEKYTVKINKELEDKRGAEVRKNLSEYFTAWAQFYAERPMYRKYYDGVVKPYIEKYCKHLVNLDEIRLAPDPAAAP